MRLCDGFIGSSNSQRTVKPGFRKNTRRIVKMSTSRVYVPNTGIFGEIIREPLMHQVTAARESDFV